MRKQARPTGEDDDPEKWHHLSFRESERERSVNKTVEDPTGKI